MLMRDVLICGGCIVGCGIGLIGGVPILGATVEETFFPHSSSRTMLDTKRTEKTFRWTWMVDKYRDGPAKVWNFHLSDDHGNSEPFVPYRCINSPNPEGFATGEPPKTSETLPIGKSQVTSLCVDLPRWVTPTTRITVTGRLGFAGSGPWMIWQDMPVIPSEHADEIGPQP